MRIYIVRFWRRMLTINKTKEDVELLLNVGMITQEEYIAILE